MDKVEYKIRADEIKALIGENRFAEAVKIADTIDWKRVKSVQMLCTISDLYKINRRYTESRDVLLMAYDRHPTGRAIVYSLCELAIKMGEFVQAVEYYKEFVRIAPRDTGRYILQYKLYEAQEVSLEERIAVLEEFKKHDYRERWAYELAYLYHRVGLTTECIEECDEMFLWFGEGRYVMKALELKALHEPLSPEQQDRYLRYKQSHGGTIDPSIVSEKDEVGKDETRTVEIKQPTKEMPPITDSVIEAFNNNELPQEDLGETREFVPRQPDPDEIVYPHISEIKEPSVDVSTFNTMNLQESLAESLREVIGQDDAGLATGQEEQPQVKPITSEIYDEDTVSQDSGAMQELRMDFDTGEVFVAGQEASGAKELSPEPDLYEEPEPAPRHEVVEPQLNIDIKYGGNGPILGEQKFYEEKPLEDEVPGAVIHPNASYQMHNHFESMLAQDYDGQISMAVEPEPEVEKQITGQISIAEYMENWEKYKQEQQQKQFERVKQRVASETGDMFADFDEKTKAGLQERIEKAITDAIKKESYEKASGRGDWSVKREDVISAAVDEVIEEAAADDESILEGNGASDDIDIEEETLEDVGTDTNGLPIAQIEREIKEDVQEEEAPETVEEEISEETAEETSEETPEESSEKETTEAAAEDTKEETEEDTPEEEATEEPEEKSEEAPDEASEEEQESDEDSDEDEPAEEKASALEPAKDEAPQKEDKPKSDRKHHHIGNRELEERVRTMTPEEKELFGPYIHHKKSRRQIINAIDNLSMDALTGNVVVTGEEGAGTVNLAKGLIKAMQASDSNFSGKVAKITANTLNKKSTASIFDKLANGALIIQRAADLQPETVSELLKILQQENKGLVLVMEDTKEDMDRFLDKNPALKQSFNVRVDIEALDDDSLVAYAKQYALEREYSIDNLGILALHTRISERQTLDHDVTVSEVKDIVDDAIYYAEKHTVGHFVDVLVRKRYDENDMIILREKDFMHD